MPICRCGGNSKPSVVNSAGDGLTLKVCRIGNPLRTSPGVTHRLVCTPCPIATQCDIEYNLERVEEGAGRAGRVCPEGFRTRPRRWMRCLRKDVVGNSAVGEEP